MEPIEGESVERTTVENWVDLLRGARRYLVMRDRFQLVLLIDGDIEHSPGRSIQRDCGRTMDPIVWFTDSDTDFRWDAWIAADHTSGPVYEGLLRQVRHCVQVL